MALSDEFIHNYFNDAGFYPENLEAERREAFFESIRDLISLAKISNGSPAEVIRPRSAVPGEWVLGDDFECDDSLPCAGIHVGKHGNAIAFYAETLVEAQTMRDSVLAARAGGDKAVATIVGAAGDMFRVGWLRPEQCKVGDMLFLHPAIHEDPTARALARAERALRGAGFQDLGAAEWKPPLGRPPVFIPVPVDYKAQHIWMWLKSQANAAGKLNNEQERKTFVEAANAALAILECSLWVSPKEQPIPKWEDEQARIDPEHQFSDRKFWQDELDAYRARAAGGK